VHLWQKQAIDRLNPESQVEAYRLLHLTTLSRDKAVELIRKSPSLRVAQDLSLIGRADPSALPHELSLPVWSLLEQPIDSVWDPNLATIALFALSAGDSSGLAKRNQPIPISSLLTAMRNRMAIKKFPSPSLTDFEWALASVAETAPNSLNENDLKTMVGMYADESLDVFAKWDLIRIMTRFGLCNDVLAPKTMQAFLQIAVDEDFGAQRKGGTGWLTSFVLAHAAILARSNPASLTVQSISPLSSAARHPQAEARVEAWAIPLSIMAQSNPSVIDAGIVRPILSKFQDPKSDENVPGTCATILRWSICDLISTAVVTPRVLDQQGYCPVARIALPVEFSRIWELLREFEGPGCLRLSEPLTRFYETHAVGELHFENWARDADFSCVPTGRELRILVGLRAKEFTLRWCDSQNPHTKGILGGVYHDHLLQSGEGFEAVRTGWMTLSGSSHLEIH
jgi:hypothetical protein